MFKKFTLAIAIFLFAVNAYALSDGDKQINGISVFMDGGVLVWLQNPGSSATCIFGLIVVGDLDGPQAVVVNAMYALLLSAKASGKPVSLDFEVDPADSTRCTLTAAAVK